MKIIKKQLTIFILVLICFNGYAQERTIKGFITTFDSIPLIGVKLKVISSKQVFYTDTLGHFKVLCQPEDKIKISARGFNSRKATVNEKIKVLMVNLKLKPTEKSREIAIGYGYVKDMDKLYSISSLENKNDRYSSYTNVLDMIRGRFPNVVVDNNGNIVIRGVNTLYGSNAALIVVDGVISDPGILRTLSPSVIKSINILKDSSSSIYGSRGSNGVVIIETKKGGDQ